MTKSSTSPRSKSVRQSEGYIFICRYNLLDCLSAGVIKPGCLLTKQYPDPSSMCPGYVAVFLQPIALDAFKELWDQEPQNFPTMVKVPLALESFGKPLCLVNAEYDIERRGDIRDGDICLLVSPFVECGTEAMISFRSAEEEAEFLSVPYDNIDLDAVKPATIQNDGTDAFALDVNLLRSKLGTSPVDATEDRIRLSYKLADSIAGALLAADVYVSRKGERDPYEWIASLMAPVFPGTAITGAIEKLKKQMASLPVAALAGRLPSIGTQIASGRAFYQTVDRLNSEPQVPEQGLFIGPPSAELSFFTAITHAILARPTHANSISIVSSVRELYCDYWGTEESPEKPPDEVVSYQRAITAMNDILHGEGTMPHLSKWPTVLAGSLLFLLRPEIDRVQRWQDERDEIGLSDEAMFVATMLAGLYSGIELLSTRERRVGRYAWIHHLAVEMTRSFVDPTAATTRIATRSIKTKKAAPGCSVFSDGDFDLVVLVPDDKASAASRKPKQQDPKQVDPVKAVGASKEQLPAPVNDPTITALPSPGIQTTVPPEHRELDRLRAVDNPSAEDLRIAREICRSERWFDCLLHSIDLTEADYRFERRGDRHVLEVTGDLPRTITVIWERFKTRAQAVSETGASKKQSS